METTYDAIIIGAGPGGYATALQLAHRGRNVALLDSDMVIGGTCLNRGCIPSKALLTAAHSLDEMRRAARFGVSVEQVNVHFDQVCDFKNGSVATMRQGLMGLLIRQGVTCLHARALEITKHTVRAELLAGQYSKQGVAEQDVSKQGDSCDTGKSHESSKSQDSNSIITLEAHDIIIATGSKPIIPDYVTIDDRIVNSDGALALQRIPKSAVIIGAGAIAIEFASIWAAFGVHVTMLIRKDRVLSKWDKPVGATLTKALQERGITILTQTNVVNVQRSDNGVAVTYDRNNAQGKPHQDQQQYDRNQPGKSYQPIDDRCDAHAKPTTPTNQHFTTIEADVALIAIGRQTTINTQWVHDLGLTTNHGALVTDEYGRTNVEHIWALGDCVGGTMLAHRAFEQAIVVAKTICQEQTQSAKDVYVPDVVFSIPQAAHVGYHATEAKEAGFEQISITRFPTSANARMMMDNETGTFQLITGLVGTKRCILGCSMVGPQASEIISSIRHIVQQQTPLDDIAQHLQAHPTLSEMLSETVLKAQRNPLHLP